MTTPGEGTDQNPYHFGATQPNQGMTPPSYQGPPSYPAQHGSSPTQSAVNNGKGFFGALFDINFDNFISVKFAKLIYLIAMILAALALFAFWVVPFFGALLNGALAEAVAVLFLAWIPVGLISLLCLISVRLFLEFAIATVKTSENTSRIVEQTRG